MPGNVPVREIKQRGPVFQCFGDEVAPAARKIFSMPIATGVVFRYIGRIHDSILSLRPRA